MLKRTFKRSHNKISANKCNGVFHGNQSKHESLCFVAQGNTASFFSALFFIFLYLTPFVTAYDKVQKSQLQEELSLVPAFGCHQNASDIFTQQRGKGKRKNQRQISQLCGHCVSSRARSSHVWRKEPVWPGNLGS